MRRNGAPGRSKSSVLYRLKHAHAALLLWWGVYCGVSQGLYAKTIITADFEVPLGEKVVTAPAVAVRNAQVDFHHSTEHVGHVVVDA